MLRFSPLLLLLPAAALAQTSEVVQKVDAKLEAERAAQRAEDVEILRRLLNKGCGLPHEARVVAEPAVRTTTEPAPPFSLVTPEYQDEWNKRFAEWSDRNPLKPGGVKTAAAVGPFDGVYLPGAGVVYTLHVPAGVELVHHGERLGLKQSCGACHTGITARDKHPTTAAANQCSTCHDAAVSHPEKALSDWERVRQDLRGEQPKTADPSATPPEQKPRAAVCEPGSLQTLVTGVLAANAMNVRHLPEKEGVTVVVTFDELKPGAKAAKPVIESYSPFDPQPLPAKPGFSADEVKALSLGDLHLKQGKYAEAVTAYSAALARFPDKEFKLTGPANMTVEQRGEYADEFQKGVRDAMKSYAKALLLADRPEAAKKALELATGFVVLQSTAASVPAKATGPAKLIVRVTPADLAAAKDAAEARKAVKAERVNFPK